MLTTIHQKFTYNTQQFATCSKSMELFEPYSLEKD